jgi:hypothetical protein
MLDVHRTGRGVLIIDAIAVALDACDLRAIWRALSRTRRRSPRN